MTDKFSSQDLIETQELLTELFNEVKVAESTLSGGVKLGKGGNALQGLRETKVTFGNPTDNLIRLTPKLFEEVGLELTEIYKRQMRQQFNFYYMTLAVSMQPKRGANFTRLECGLDFGPKGASEPIVQTIFPKNEWHEALSWGGGMYLGLDDNLNWSLGVDIPNLESKAATLKTNLNIAHKNELKAFITMPDFAFHLGRFDIAATGEGNSECFWRIDKSEIQNLLTAHFGLVFKVPKDVTSLELTGTVIANASVDWLISNLRDVARDLSDHLKELLRRIRKKERELPIGDHEKWTLPLPN